MLDPIKRRSRKSRVNRRSAEASVQEATIAREQAIRPLGDPDAGRLTTEGAKRPTITLKTGAVVDARCAVAIVGELRALLTVDPEEFQSLLALAQGNPNGADSRHFQSLKTFNFLEQDGKSIRPIVREIMLNCYESTHDGPVIVPLRLKDAADLPVAEQAQEQLDRWLHNILSGGKGQGHLRD